MSEPTPNHLPSTFNEAALKLARQQAPDIPSTALPVLLMNECDLLPDHDEIRADYHLESGDYASAEDVLNSVEDSAPRLVLPRGTQCIGFADYSPDTKSFDKRRWYVLLNTADLPSPCATQQGDDPQEDGPASALPLNGLTADEYIRLRAVWETASDYLMGQRYPEFAKDHGGQDALRSALQAAVDTYEA